MWFFLLDFTGLFYKNYDLTCRLIGNESNKFSLSTAITIKDQSACLSNFSYCLSAFPSLLVKTCENGHKLHFLFAWFEVRLVPKTAEIVEFIEVAIER